MLGHTKSFINGWVLPRAQFNKDTQKSVTALQEVFDHRLRVRLNEVGICISPKQEADEKRLNKLLPHIPHMWQEVVEVNQLTQ